MIPPSNTKLVQGKESKYAIVVAIAKQARILSESNKDNENYRLSSMVSEALEELVDGKLVIYHGEEKDMAVITPLDEEK